jgi:hypothetical protein
LQAVAADKILKNAPGSFVTHPAIPEPADAASMAMGSIGTGREALEAR